MRAASIADTHLGTSSEWGVLFVITHVRPTGVFRMISVARHSFTYYHPKNQIMKIEFLSRVWNMFRADVAAAIVELYIHRYDLALTREQEISLDVLQVQTLRSDLSRNLYGFAWFLSRLLEDDELSDFVNILLSESPRIENWPLCRLILQVYVDTWALLIEMKRAS